MTQPTPDVAAILNALAQKNAAAASNSQPGPAAPGAYMNNNGTPVPLNHAAYPAAPPPSSNEPDLSQISPANKGILMNDIGDAISKATAIAKSHGVGGERGREGDRPYSQSRNRSRSPQRGAPPYNPYRDERRDENRRGTGYGRERSCSPERSSYTGYTRDSTREARGPIKEESSSETITVDSSSVGLIIGRGGDSMRRIEQESGARVQFMQDQSQPRRQCRITGTKHQRAEAIAEIFRVANSEQTGSSTISGGRQNTNQHNRSGGAPQPAEGENNTQIWVPDRTVGLIIGRGGETIRDLQEKSGCHVNITAKEQSENGFRPVNLIGTPRTATLARKLIDEIVQSDTRGGAGPSQDQPYHKPADYPGAAPPNMAGYQNYGLPPQYSNTYGGDAPHNGGDGKITDTTVVPSEAVGMIIGKGGETIKDMQNTSSCKINVDPPGQPDINRRIELIGTPPSIETAKHLIWDKVQTVREKQGGNLKSGQQDSPHPQQPSYGQMPPMPQPTYNMPPAPGAASAPQAAHPLDADYAAYGGFENFRAIWAAAERSGPGAA